MINCPILYNPYQQILFSKFYTDLGNSPVGLFVKFRQGLHTIGHVLCLTARNRAKFPYRKRVGVLNANLKKNIRGFRGGRKLSKKQYIP